MEKIIKLHSRSGNDNYLELINGKTYALKTTYPYVRVGYIDNSRDSAKFIDPSGGPMMIEGEVLEELGKVIKRIDFVQGEGTFIELEE